MDETAPATTLALESKESLTTSAFDFDFFLFSSTVTWGGDLALSGGGFHTVIGRAVNGCATTAPKELFAFMSGLGGDNEGKPRDDDARSGSWTGEEGMPPIPEPLPRTTTPALILEHKREGTHPNSEPQPEAVMPALVLE